MPGIRLTQRRVDALPRRRAVRDVRDTELKGYGVRVMPSGAKRYFIHSQHQGRRVWKIVGDAETTTEAEARNRARSMLAALRDGRDADAGAPGEAPFETVAEEVFTRYGRRWKPRTLQANRIYLRRQILPFFEERFIGAITRQDVQDWFRSLHATPAAANRSAPILSVIMQQAEAWGSGLHDRMFRLAGSTDLRTGDAIKRSLGVHDLKQHRFLFLIRPPGTEFRKRPVPGSNRNREKVPVIRHPRRGPRQAARPPRCRDTACRLTAVAMAAALERLPRFVARYREARLWPRGTNRRWTSTLHRVADPGVGKDPPTRPPGHSRIRICRC